MEIAQVNMDLSEEGRYVGTLKNGVFHGTGTILFSDGGIYRGVWKDGNNISGTYIFSDGLPYASENWSYCSLQDRRFWSEICNGLGPGELAQETNIQPTPVLPYNHYDTGDGMYSPEDDTIFSYDGRVLRKPSEKERTWILKFCRRGVVEDIENKSGKCLDDLLVDVDLLLDTKDAVSDVVGDVSDVIIPSALALDSLVDEVVIEIEEPHILAVQKLDSLVSQLEQLHMKEADANSEDGLSPDEVSSRKNSKSDREP